MLHSLTVLLDGYDKISVVLFGLVTRTQRHLVLNALFQSSKKETYNTSQTNITINVRAALISKGLPRMDRAELYSRRDA